MGIRGEEGGGGGSYVDFEKILPTSISCFPGKAISVCSIFEIDPETSIIDLNQCAVACRCQKMLFL